MLKADKLTITNIRKELDIISNEMLSLIKKYKLMANSQLEVVEMARNNITDQKDYIRFLELSLEGRIYGDAATALEKATVEQQSSATH
jgi:hypothetical protein